MRPGPQTQRHTHNTRGGRCRAGPASGSRGGSAALGDTGSESFGQEFLQALRGLFQRRQKRFQQVSPVPGQTCPSCHGPEAHGDLLGSNLALQPPAVVLRRLQLQPRTAACLGVSGACGRALWSYAGPLPPGTISPASHH